MKRLKFLEIEYDMDAQEYAFRCPYCNTKFVLPVNIDCKHYWFCYESINGQPMHMHDALYSAIEEKLMNNRTKGPEEFQSMWLSEYKPEKGKVECYREAYEESRRECVQDYLDNRISMDDMIWFMDRLPQFKGFRGHATIAYVDDCEGNITSYLFMDDTFSE